MRAIQLNSPGSIEIKNYGVRATRKPVTRIRVISTGICAADKYLWTGNHPWKIKYPIVPGHELFGEITEVDPIEYPGVEVGSRVSVQVLVPCYKCVPCKKASFNMCIRRAHFGSTYPGGFADTVLLPSGSRIHVFTREIDDLVGGLAETMANAIYCSSKVKPGESQRVLILGMGSIGACLSIYLKTKNPKIDLSVLTSSTEKSKVLRNLGITPILRSNDRKPKNFDIIFETSGFEDNVGYALEALNPQGALVLYGVFRDRYSVDLNQISEFKELSVFGGHLANDEAFDESAEFLIQNQKNLKFLISNVVGFDNFASAFSSPKSNHFKTVFQPSYSSGVN